MLPTYRSEQFRYDAARKTFSTEASDLQRVGAPLFGRVFLDAIDEGLCLISKATGREATFVVEHQEAREGETLYWELKPTAASARQEPGLAGCKLIIFND